jgi:hypothetical protein
MEVCTWNIIVPQDIIKTVTSIKLNLFDCYILAEQKCGLHFRL